jgi:hypothetical protein
VVGISEISDARLRVSRHGQVGRIPDAVVEGDRQDGSAGPLRYCGLLVQPCLLGGDLALQPGVGQIRGPRGLAKVGQWRQQFHQRLELDLAVLGGCRNRGRERPGVDRLVGGEGRDVSESRSRVVVAARSTMVTSFSARTVSIG